MDLSRIGLFQLAEQRLDWIDRRQPLLASNIANADTPGYKPRDLVSFAAMLADASPELAQTSPRHLTGTIDPLRNARVRPKEISPDGNAISVEGELTKLADTESIHGTTTQLYTTYVAMFRTALGKGA
jgi:flagellar basal-body rod protein FlgB